MYKILYYNELSITTLKRKFEKTIAYLEQGNFKSAEIKKLKPSRYYRAKLDDTNRLLFLPMRSRGVDYIVLLELIEHHDYSRSRFLRGVSRVEEEHVESLQLLDEKESSMVVNSSAKKVHCLNKFIVFDDTQSAILDYTLPLIVIGSAGSGKTSITLEKLKSLNGELLYVSLSNYLVQHTQLVYYSQGYENNKQTIDFLSFHEYLESIFIPTGKEITPEVFNAWLSTQNRPAFLKDGQKLFEEIRGVITGANPYSAYFKKEEYLALGVKQSIYLAQERLAVYAIFERYLSFLNQGDYYDSNILASHYQQQVLEKYDAVVVDEVQDFTNSQLSLVLKSLREKGQFLLCGDANQIVHPNFFSWSKLKSYFYEDSQLSSKEITRILTKNYRNTPEVTELANRVLKLKNYRFGSIDKESHYLVESTSTLHGSVACFESTPKLINDMNKKTGQSTKYAILVLNEEAKVRAKAVFETPLIFTIQQAKGLEYENVILFDFISSESKYDEIVKGLDQRFLSESFEYARAKQKTDKSLEVFKFYINALYVAITRAIKNVYMVESCPNHHFLKLLDVNEIKEINIEMEKQHFNDYAYRNVKSMHRNVDRYGVDFRNVFNLTPLMCAAYMGSGIHIDELLSLGADIEAVDNENRTAFLVALSRALNDPQWLDKKFTSICRSLQPNAISFRVEDRLIKINTNQSEYFVCLLLCIYCGKQVKTVGRSSAIAFRAKHLLKILAQFPDVLVPAYRKQQAYLNSLLARNEVNSDYPCNRKLFVRVHLGVYILNPALKWRIKSTWVDFMRSET